MSPLPLLEKIFLKNANLYLFFHLNCTRVFLFSNLENSFHTPCCLSSAAAALPMMVHTGRRHPRSPSKNPRCVPSRYPTSTLLLRLWVGVTGAERAVVLGGLEETSDFSVRLSWSASCSSLSMLETKDKKKRNQLILKGSLHWFAISENSFDLDIQYCYNYCIWFDIIIVYWYIYILLCAHVLPGQPNSQ